MIKKIDKNKARKKRHFKIRRKVSGTSQIPRLNIFRSNKAIYAQVIDDITQKTLFSASSKELKLEGNNIEVSTKVGELIAKKAKDNKIEQVVFDRGGYVYHGKIKALADAAREAGLKI
ncbi:MAG: 50S ribosomal protein L18 [Mycoplasmatales bacterium]